MTIHFAAARPQQPDSLARHRGRIVLGRAANDNGRMERDNVDTRLVHAALRHFSRHGLSAAREARAQARTAFFAGDRVQYRWWLDVCRVLDKRLAASLDTMLRAPLANGDGDR
jgi:hypothetical protein